MSAGSLRQSGCVAQACCTQTKRSAHGNLRGRAAWPLLARKRTCSKLRRSVGNPTRPADGAALASAYKKSGQCIHHRPPEDGEHCGGAGSAYRRIKASCPSPPSARCVCCAGVWAAGSHPRCRKAHNKNAIRLPPGTISATAAYSPSSRVELERGAGEVMERSSILAFQIRFRRRLAYSNTRCVLNCT